MARTDHHLADRMAPRALNNDLEEDLAMLFAFELEEMMDDDFADFDVHLPAD